MIDHNSNLAPPTSAMANMPFARIQFFLCFLYIMLKPFYIWAAGQPQIADFVLVLLFLVNLFSFRGNIPKEIASIVTVAGIFAFYTVIVNLGWAAYRNDMRMGSIGIFYIFNFLVLVVITNLVCQFGREFIKYLVLALFFSVVLQTMLSLGFQNSSVKRQIMFFTNPNQLGYFALLSATMFATCTSVFALRPLYQLLFYVFALYLAALSLSKAALVSFAFLLSLHLLKKPYQLAIMAVFVIGLASGGSELRLVQNVENRINNIGQQSDDSAERRGYGRIWNYPEYLITGAGERGLDRFEGATHEFHSTLGTIVFSYGVIGTIAFLIMIFKIWSFSGLGLVMYLVPPFLFGLTHQGLRFSFLWILFGILAAFPIAKADQLARDGTMKRVGRD